MRSRRFVRLAAVALVSLVSGTAWPLVAQTPTTAPIVVEGVVRAPAAEVWAAFTTSAGLRSWLAPHAEVDLRLDGLMRTNYRADATLADPDTITNRILAFEPERMLSFRIERPPSNFPFPNAAKAMWTVLTFTPIDARRTRLRTVSLGFTPDDESQQMRTFFVGGNRMTLEELQKRFAK